MTESIIQSQPVPNDFSIFGIIVVYIDWSTSSM